LLLLLLLLLLLVMGLLLELVNACAGALRMAVTFADTSDAPTIVGLDVVRGGGSAGLDSR